MYDSSHKEPPQDEGYNKEKNLSRGGMSGDKISSTKARKKDVTTSRNVKTFELRVKNGCRGDASMPGSVVGQERRSFGLSSRICDELGGDQKLEL